MQYSFIKKDTGIVFYKKEFITQDSLIEKSGSNSILGSQQASQPPLFLSFTTKT